MKIGKCELLQYSLRLMNANMFIVISGDSALIIDPNADEEALNMLKDSDIGNVTIILTHEHFDHISGVNAIRDVMTGKTCKVIASERCAQMITDPDKNLSSFFEAMFITKSKEERLQALELFDTDYCCEADVTFENNLELAWNEFNLQLTETPGHSPGSICIEFYDKDGKIFALATGDSLVEGNKVITRLPGGDKEAYKNVTRPYLERFDGNTLVLPGHGVISSMRDLELG